MKSLPVHLRDFFERHQRLEEELQEEQEVYNKGNIKNYPVLTELEFNDISFITESLIISGPVKPLIKKLSEQITGIFNIYSVPFEYVHSEYIRPSENKYIRMQISVNDFERQKEEIEKILNFWGFYVNSYSEETEVPMYYIYPKFQGKFLLNNEKYLMHVTSTIYLNKIKKKQGLKPYSKLSKYNNVQKFTHNEEYLNLYSKLPKSWFHYNHPDKIHFFLGSKVQKFLSRTYINKFFGSLGSELTLIVIDTSKILPSTSFCIVPNSSSKEVVTVCTEENISPSTILYYNNITSEMSQKEISECLNKLYKFVL